MIPEGTDAHFTNSPPLEYVEVKEAKSA